MRRVRTTSARIWTWLEGRLRRLKAPRSLPLTLGGAFSFATAARSGALPFDSLWAAGSVANWSVMVLGVATGASTQVYRWTRDSQYEPVQRQCSRLATYVAERCPSIRLEDLTVHIWVVQGPPFAERLRRRGVFSLADQNTPRITFTKGVGLIGAVWEEGGMRIFNANGTKSKKQFDALSKEKRFGLSWDDFNALRKVYPSVWGNPLRRPSDEDRRVRGVLSVGLHTPGNHPEFARALDRKPDTVLWSILHDIENSLWG
jgi:hypothetical protein